MGLNQKITSDYLQMISQFFQKKFGKLLLIVQATDVGELRKKVIQRVVITANGNQENRTRQVSRHGFWGFQALGKNFLDGFSEQPHLLWQIQVGTLHGFNFHSQFSRQKSIRIQGEPKYKHAKLFGKIVVKTLYQNQYGLNF